MEEPEWIADRRNHIKELYLAMKFDTPNNIAYEERFGLNRFER